MTNGQLRAIAALSMVATVFVLAGGSSNGDTLLAAALRQPRTVTAHLPASPSPSSDTPDDTADFSSDAGSDSPAPAADSEPAASPSDDSTSSGDSSGSDDSASTPTEPEPKPTQVKHVFEIVLAGHGLDATFGDQSPAPYLAKQLRPQGALLTAYEPLAGEDLPDYLALISGQPPNPSTRAGCPTFKEFPQSTQPTKSGEIRADGCVYPNTVITLADQLAADGRTWGAYLEDLDKGTPPKTACRRPDSNTTDDTLESRPGDGYATRHNPFVYFHSLLDLSGCDTSDVPLAKLDVDLASEKTTPDYVFVAPNLCNSGTEAPCGLAQADAFLATWVPKILASPAYRKDGLLIVTFAGGTAGAPNGTLLLSRFVQAGVTSDQKLNPYGLLRSVEDVLALKPLARAKQAPSLLDSVLAGAKLAQPGDD